MRLNFTFWELGSLSYENICIFFCHLDLGAFLYIALSISKTIQGLISGGHFTLILGIMREKVHILIQPLTETVKTACINKAQ